jgi:hypothetical protein
MRALSLTPPPSNARRPPRQVTNPTLKAPFPFLEKLAARLEKSAQHITALEM